MTNRSSRTRDFSVWNKTSDEIIGELDFIEDDLESMFLLLVFFYYSHSVYFLFNKNLIIILLVYLIFTQRFTVDLQDTTLALHFRVTAFEENGGGDGNSSVAELEVRMETLEGTAADHETRISATEVDIDGNSSLNELSDLLLTDMFNARAF